MATPTTVPRVAVPRGALGAVLITPPRTSLAPSPIGPIRTPIPFPIMAQEAFEAFDPAALAPYPRADAAPYARAIDGLLGFARA